MKTIETKFGAIYIEELNEKRDEEERIKCFDSQMKYFDYFSLESLMESAEQKKCSIENILNLYIEGIKECITIYDFCEYMVVGYELITKDLQKACDFMNLLCIDEYNSEEELLTNEWVNKIGEYYVIVSEY